MTTEELIELRDKIKAQTNGKLCLSIQLTRLGIDRDSRNGLPPNGKLAILLIELLREAGERGILE